MAYLALTGGIGGAKLALGLAHVLGPEEMVFVVNTGDDFEHLGPAHLAGPRHSDLHPGRPQQHRHRVGPGR